MARRIEFLFWAPFRRTVKFVLVCGPGCSADFIAQCAHIEAIKRFMAKWPFPRYDRKRMRILRVQEVAVTQNQKEPS